MMKRMRLLLMLSLLLALQPGFAQKKTAAEKMGWQLGAQAYTFRMFTFAETLDKLHSVGIHEVEAYNGQEIGGGIEGEISYKMDTDTRKRVKELLKAKNVKLVRFGVVSGQDARDWEKLFEFAKEMGIGVITSEPKTEDLDMVDQLAGKYGIKVALHNHPEPSHYWKPETVLASIEGRKNLGVCADVGHWVRSGLDPIACLKKLEGHIISLHFKDLNEKSGEAHDVPWGTGVSNVDGMLKELKRQGFKGGFSIEYEHNWENSLPEVAECVKYFNQVTSTL